MSLTSGGTSLMVALELPNAASPHTDCELSMTRSRNMTIGLILSAILGVLDVVSVAGLGADDGPPAFVIVIGLVLGVVTLVGVAMAWRGNARGVPIIVVSRVLSALSAIPAFFVEEAPDWAPPVVGVGIVITIAAIALIYSGRRTTELPS